MPVTAKARTSAVRRFFARLRRDQSGSSLIEFAYSMPILMLLGFTR